MAKIDFVFYVLQVICLVCGLLQILIDPSADNLICTLLVVVSTSAVLQYLRISRAPMKHPVSSLAILGLCATTVFMSLVAQTFYWNSVIYMLRAPLLTFSVLAVVQLLAIVAHLFVTRVPGVQGVRDFLAERVVLPLGGFSVPSVGSIWVMAFFGAIAMLFKGVAETGNAGGKFFEALSFFAYLPYMIPLYYISFGDRYCSIKKQIFLVIIYALVIVAVGVVKNARQIMLIGPIQALFIYLIYTLQNPSPVTSRSVKKLVLVLFFGLLSLQLVADLATAMVINRDMRRTASPVDMILATIDTMGDRARIDMYRQEAFDIARYKSYDEAYIPNPVLARFSETKFHDNIFYISSRLSDAAREDLRDMIVDKIKVLLPQAMLNKIGWDIYKDRYFFSMGDYYRVLNQDGYAFGGFATGSIWADIINVFEWWSPIFAFFMMVISFVLMDSLSRAKVGILSISPVVLCASWTIFIYGLGGESIVARIGIAFREIPQRLFLFVAAYWFFALFSKRAVKIDGVAVHMNAVGPSGSNKN